MIVVFSENFSTQLDELIAFIANDSLQKANKFDKELRINLNTLDFMPTNTENLCILIMKMCETSYLKVLLCHILSMKRQMKL